MVDVVTLQLRETLNNIDGASLADLVHNIVTASKISCYGVGREGLAMKGLAMRLYHLGFQVSVVGEMTAAAVGKGDVLLLSAGPGYFSTVAALSEEARRAGAQVVVFTSAPPPQLAVPAHLAIHVPATCLPAAPPCKAQAEGALQGVQPQDQQQQQQCEGGGHPPAADTGACGPVGSEQPGTEGSGDDGGRREGGGAERQAALPMGSSYELALQLLFDAVCLLLQQELRASEADMRRRHTNLE